MKHVDLALSDFHSHKQAIIDLGKRHKNRGIELAHYDVVGQALLKTLADALGDDFTLELKQYWTQLYGLVAKTMQGDNYTNLQATPNPAPASTK